MNKNEKSLRVSRPVEYSLVPAFPVNIMIGLTNTCNQRCVFCAYGKTILEPVCLPLYKSLDYIEQAYKLGSRELGFALICEPFMSRDLEQCVSYAKNIGYEYVYITTNGVLAGYKRMERLINDGLDSIKFSVNAGKAETYKKIHGTDDFEKVMQNIKDASKLKTKLKSNMAIFVSFVQNSINNEEIEILKTRLSGLYDNFYSYIALNQGGNMVEEIKDGIVNKNVKNSSINESIWQGQLKSENTIFCNQVFNRFHITAEGFFTACCNDVKNMLVLADLNKLTLEEAWACENARMLRSYFVNQVIPKNILCYNCINNSNNISESIQKVY
jgi:MoaA/NifB/PqqE/SkfB family radical SAM enzyme